MILTQFEENRAWNKKLNKIKVDTFYFFNHILITIVKSNKELINYSIKRILAMISIIFQKLIILLIESKFHCGKFNDDNNLWFTIWHSIALMSFNYWCFREWQKLYWFNHSCLSTYYIINDSIKVNVYADIVVSVYKSPDSY